MQNKKKDERKELLDKILAKYNAQSEFPKEKLEETAYSAEYKIFREEEAESRVRNTYEKLCNYSENLIKITPSESKRKHLESAIRFTGLKVTPTGAVSFASIATVLFLLFALILFVLPIAVVVKLLGLTLTILISYLLFSYPEKLANRYRIESGSDLVMSVLYMTIYMKSSPNLEGALRFAANNITGRVAMEMKSILWSVESGKYSTVEEGLGNYLARWKEYNKEFVEAMLLIREAMVEPSNSRRSALFDKAIDVILVGTDEKMKRYARELETPIMLLEGLGILLPVMGMVAFPLVMIFLNDEVKNIGYYVAFAYDLLLPAMVYFFMQRTLEMRPATHTKIDISNHPDYITGNNIMLTISDKKYSIPALPLSIVVTLILSVPGINYMMSTNFFSTEKMAQMNMDHGIISMLFSISLIFALAAGIIVYTYSTSFQRLHLRRNISKIENEFEDALFALGSRLASGTPIESALVNAAEDTKELNISEMFHIILKNINRMSMTFRQALFDANYGAIRYYPSAQIATVMKAVTESIDKGTTAASMSMLTISRYLRDIHSTQERIENLLSSIISSLKFQGFVLIPVMSAVVVAVAQLMIQILINLGAQFADLQKTIPEGAGGLNPAMIFGDMRNVVPPEVMQLIVGIYALEILVILGIFITRIEFGSDETEERDSIWRLVLFGMVIYAVVLVVVMAVFSPLIKAAGGMI